MKLPDYISVEEVRRVCKALKIRDWTRLKKPEVPAPEARKILSLVNTGKMKIEPEEFRKGLEVELEHGTMFPDANVTNNHPVLTGKIVLAHLKESLDYYKLLEVAETEGDLLKAMKAKDMAKALAKFKKLLSAQLELNTAMAKQLR